MHLSYGTPSQWWVTLGFRTDTHTYIPDMHLSYGTPSQWWVTLGFRIAYASLLAVSEGDTALAAQTLGPTLLYAEGGGRIGQQGETMAVLLQVHCVI